MASASPLTVFGSFGYGNLGDELVPECFEHLLAAAGHASSVAALSRFGKIEPGRAGRYPDKTERCALRDHTLVLTGGGIIEARDMSCMNRAFALASAVPSLRIATHAISVEPGVRFTWNQRRTLRQQLQKIGQVNVRDNLSAETLGGLVSNPKVRVIGDIALWMQASNIPPALAALVPEKAIPVILADVWDTDDFYDWLSSELAHLARGMSCPLMMLPFSYDFGEDMKVHTRIRDLLARVAPDVDVVFPLETLDFSIFTPSVVAALLARAPLTVAMRLHGCVMSYAMRTPFLGIAYHPKLRGFAQTIGQPAALIPYQLPPRQSPGAYGFSFADLDIAPGILSRSADAVLADSDFSAISYFRRQQIVAINDLLGSGFITRT